MPTHFSINLNIQFFNWWCVTTWPFQQHHVLLSAHFLCQYLQTNHIRVACRNSNLVVFRNCTLDILCWEFGSWLEEQSSAGRLTRQGLVLSGDTLCIGSNQWSFWLQSLGTYTLGTWLCSLQVLFAIGQYPLTNNDVIWCNNNMIRSNISTSWWSDQCWFWDYEEVY